jgi:hypothetical protein
MVRSIEHGSYLQAVANRALLAFLAELAIDTSSESICDAITRRCENVFRQPLCLEEPDRCVVRFARVRRR